MNIAPLLAGALAGEALATDVLDGGERRCQLSRVALQHPHLPGAWRSSLLVSALVALACGGASTASGTRSSAEPPAPIEPPGPGASGCVESADLKAFVLALEAQRAEARARALAQLGVVERPRAGRFVEPPAAPGTGVHEPAGRRLVVVAHLATRTPPLVPLAQREQLLQLLDERPRSHPLPVRACGVNPCAPPVPPLLPPVRAVAVALAPGEELGPPLQLSYDYWWAQVSYDRARRCPAPPAVALPAGGAGKH